MQHKSLDAKSFIFDPIVVVGSRLAFVAFIAAIVGIQKIQCWHLVNCQSLGLGPLHKILSMELAIKRWQGLGLNGREAEVERNIELNCKQQLNVFRYLVEIFPVSPDFIFVLSLPKMNMLHLSRKYVRTKFRLSLKCYQ